jgi:hypothetical protein
MCSSATRPRQINYQCYCDTKMLMRCVGKIQKLSKIRIDHFIVLFILGSIQISPALVILQESLKVVLIPS